MRSLLRITSLTGYIRRVVEVHSEFSVKYMFMLGNYVEYYGDGENIITGGI